MSTCRCLSFHCARVGGRHQFTVECGHLFGIRLTLHDAYYEWQDLSRGANAYVCSTPDLRHRDRALRWTVEDNRPPVPWG
jgi:hypothetical protein